MLIALVVILALSAWAFWVIGPREPVDTAISFDVSAIDPADPDAYLARAEADIPNLRPNASKEIVWAYPASRARTPITIVYIHGFSASKAEVRPLADEVARALGANLFYTRLTGHGRDPAALEQTTVNAWLNDLAEATAVGRTIGNRVIVIGTSTGGTLATLGATLAKSHPMLMQDVAGLVLISPNFGVQGRWAFLLDMPFARKALPYIGGSTRAFEPLNAAMGENWTTTYPIAALAPMAALIRATLASDLSKISIPVLTLFSPADKIVDPDKTGQLMTTWGAPHEVVEVPVSGDPSNHILAGDIVSPKTTASLALRIVEWVGSLPQ